jgi:hypothetical protein
MRQITVYFFLLKVIPSKLFHFTKYCIACHHRIETPISLYARSKTDLFFLQKPISLYQSL